MIKNHADPIYVWKYTPKENDFYLDNGLSVYDLSVQVNYPNADEPVNLFVETVNKNVLQKTIENSHLLD